MYSSVFSLHLHLVTFPIYLLLLHFLSLILIITYSDTCFHLFVYFSIILISILPPIYILQTYLFLFYLCHVFLLLHNTNEGAVIQSDLGSSHFLWVVGAMHGCTRYCGSVLHTSHAAHLPQGASPHTGSWEWANPGALFPASLPPGSGGHAGSRGQTM